MKPRLAAVVALTTMLAASSAFASDDESSSITLGYKAGWFVLGGLTTGGSSSPAGGGAYLGGEASVVRLRRSWWQGVYLDGAYDFGHDRATFTAGPEFGWSVFGIDGGVGVRPGDEGVELGPQIRGLLTFGILSFYARYGFWPDSQEQRHVRQYGVLLKVPLVSPWGFGPSAPWDMGDKPRAEP